MLLDAETRAFVDAQRLGRLATVDETGQPHVVPICFALEDDRLYSAIDEKPKARPSRPLRRLGNIAANPHVQVLFDLYDDADWSRLRWVQLRGRARILEPGEEHRHAVALLRGRYPQYRAMALETRPVIAVDLERVVSWRHGANEVDE